MSSAKWVWIKVICVGYEKLIRFWSLRGNTLDVLVMAMSLYIILSLVCFMQPSFLLKSLKPFHSKGQPLI